MHPGRWFGFARELQRGRVAGTTPLVFLGCAALVACYGALLIEDAALTRLAAEDGPIESLGAVAFLLAGVCCVGRFCGRRERRNGWILLLGLAFLFAAGEEISWGQRMVGFGTPEFLAETNQQGEANLHNLPLFHGLDDAGGKKSGWRLWLTMERLFALFWLGYCVVVPLLDASSRRLSRWIAGLRLPVVPLSIGLLFPVNQLIYKLVECTGIPESSALHWPLTEIKETAFAVLFLLVALWFVRARPVRYEPSTPATP